MRYLKAHAQGWLRCQSAEVQFLVSPKAPASMLDLIESHLASPKRAIRLDIEEPDRGVYRLDGEGSWVLKRNTLRAWRKQVVNRIGLQRSFGVYGLTNEFQNFRAISQAAKYSIMPVAYGWKLRSPLHLRDEYLVLPFLEGYQTLDEVLKRELVDRQQALSEVFSLFYASAKDGFVHLDPHPKNLMRSAAGQWKYIDLEFATDKVLDPCLVLGFLFGYAYHYWLKRFFAAEEYSQNVLVFFQSQAPLNFDWVRFVKVYSHFRDNKVSRKERYACMTSPRVHDKFMGRVLAANYECAVLQRGV